MNQVAQNIGWAVVFSFIGGIVGIALVLVSSLVLPRLIERMTPNIDEEKEIARGNTAVAEYFGRISAAIASRPPLALATWKTPAAFSNFSRSTTICRRVSITVTSDSLGDRNGPGWG